MCVMGYFAAGRAFKFSRSNPSLSVLMLAFLAQGASKAFYAIRVANWESGGSVSLIELVIRGVENIADADRLGLNEQVAENQRERTFIVEYLSELLDRTELKRPLYGDVLEMAIATATPSLLWPGKEKILRVESEEALVHPVLGLPIWDGANTILTSGVSDFGLVGFFLYPLIFALLFSLILRVARHGSGPAYAVFAFSLIGTLWSVEASLAAPVTGLRNSILACLLISAWFSVTSYIQQRTAAPFREQHSRRAQKLSLLSAVRRIKILPSL